jgi:hypothetical protein
LIGFIRQKSDKYPPIGGRGFPPKGGQATLPRATLKPNSYSKSLQSIACSLIDEEYTKYQPCNFMVSYMALGSNKHFNKDLYLLLYLLKSGTSL